MRWVTPCNPLCEQSRTYWHGLYDVDDASVELTFFVGDADGHSEYAPVVRLQLAR